MQYLLLSRRELIQLSDFQPLFRRATIQSSNSVVLNLDIQEVMDLLESLNSTAGPSSPLSIVKHQRVGESITITAVETETPLLFNLVIICRDSSAEEIKSSGYDFWDALCNLVTTSPLFLMIEYHVGIVLSWVKRKFSSLLNR